MKICRVCSIEKVFDDFPNLARSKDGKNSMCKSCKQDYDNNYYKVAPNRAAYVRKAAKDGGIRSRKMVWNYLLDHPCVDCGESDPIVLEFDHVTGEKSFNISHIARGSASWEKIYEEIQKCEVRCANCHRRVTAQRGNWYSYL